MPLTINFVVTVALCVVLVCIQIYGIYLFQSLRRLTVIRKRHPRLVTAEYIALIAFLLLALPYLQYVYIPLDYHLNEEISEDEYLDPLALISARIPTIMLGHFILNIEACRLWLINYDLHHLDSSTNQQWKNQIDHSFAEKDWYLRNRKTWGNARYVLIRAAIYYLSAMMILIFTLCYTQLRDSNNVMLESVTEAAIFSAPFVLVQYSYWKSPKRLGDTIFLHYEYQITAITWFIGYVVYVATTLMMFYSGFTLFGFMMMSISSICILSISSLVSTLWIPCKIRSSPIWVCHYVLIETEYFSVSD